MEDGALSHSSRLGIRSVHHQLQRLQWKADGQLIEPAARLRQPQRMHLRTAMCVEDFTQRMHLRTAMCVEDFLWNLGLCAARRRRQGNKRSEGTGPCTAASFPKCATSTLRRRTYTSASAAPRERATSKPTELLQANAAAFQRQAQTAATSREVVGRAS